MRRKLLICLIAMLMLVPPQAIFAQTTDRQAALAQLEEILQQLNELRAQLEALRSPEPRVLGASTRAVEQSKYYSGPYEAIYIVEGVLLLPYRNTVRSQKDMDVWNLWRQVVGNQVTSTYITEFRLYRDPDAEYDAFVEEVGQGDWIFGVNLAAVNLASRPNRESIIELFIHEYAHILHYYERDVSLEFEDRFWDPPYRGDRYYVSDYAQIDSEEDFAESFAHFVLNPRPNGDTVIDEKIRFFYQYEFFRELRDEIRGRLSN